MKSIVLIGILFFITPVSWSGDIDLSITITPSTFNTVHEDDTGEFVITITNNGPDTAGLNSPLNLPISIDTEIINLDESYFVVFSANPDVTQDCGFYTTLLEPLPGNPAGIIYSFFTPNISAGQSINCYGTFRIRTDIDARKIEWSPFSYGDTDTDPINDIAVMNFGGQTTPVPSLSLLGLISLALFVICIGILTLYQKTR